MNSGYQMTFSRRNCRTELLKFTNLITELQYFTLIGPSSQQVLHEGLRVHGLHHGEGVLVQGRGSAL